MLDLKKAAACAESSLHSMTRITMGLQSNKRACGTPLLRTTGDALVRVALSGRVDLGCAGAPRLFKRNPMRKQS